MEEYPECPICLDIFGNTKNHIRCPKVLKCGDSLCKECLEKIIQTDEDFFICPICKENIKKEENIDEYTTNKEMIRIINASFNIPKNEVENQEEDPPISYNIVLLGNSNVGKTSIFERLTKDIFSEYHTASVGIDVVVYYIKFKMKKYKLLIHDSAGQVRYKSITKSIMRNKDGVLFIYDISNQESFRDLKSWYDLYKNENEEVLGLILGNKCDIERKVNQEKAKKFAEECKLKYLETSAKLDKNLRKAIASLLNIIIDAKKRKKTNAKNGENQKTPYFNLNETYSTVLIKDPKKKCNC